MKVPDRRVEMGQQASLHRRQQPPPLALQRVERPTAAACCLPPGEVRRDATGQPPVDADVRHALPAAEVAVAELGASRPRPQELKRDEALPIEAREFLRRQPRREPTLGGLQGARPTTISGDFHGHVPFECGPDYGPRPTTDTDW
ncbi:hypothetical protein [Lacipirellula limnantheis]|uniref:hypothetical protein n=1 Tax=Lacipirellula limnantheis TaxID=2528024 RepID=UPI0011A57293|nr:hypothetical protein [Lacipirellula limnantheis]